MAAAIALGYGQDTGPKGEEKEEETTQVNDVAGITIGDWWVVKREDEWSFGRGGVFIGYGTLTYSFDRPPLPFTSKLNQSWIQQSWGNLNDRTCNGGLGHLGGPSMANGHLHAANDEEMDVPERRSKRIKDLLRSVGRSLPLGSEMSNLGKFKDCHRKKDLQGLLPSETFWLWLQRCPTPPSVRSTSAMSWKDWSGARSWEDWKDFTEKQEQEEKKKKLYKEELDASAQAVKDNRRRVL